MSGTEKKQVDRGRKIVEARLIASACKLLSSRGPRSVTIRDIAKGAGVNHGQIHHYFGSKKNLLIAAIRKLANEHHRHHAEFPLDENFVPPPLSLAKDQDYIMAMIRCVIDGKMDLATLELDDGASVPRTITKQLTKNMGHSSAPTELKAAMAVVMAIEWGWAALAPYFLIALEVNDDEIEAVQKAVGLAARQSVDELLAANN